MNTLDLFKQHKVSDNFVPPINRTYIHTQNLFNENFDKIMRVKDWVVDTETTGLDFLTDEVTLLQIGDPKEQYVIDTRIVDINRLKEPFEDDTKGKLLTNATFDYLMLRGSKQIVMNCIYDTYMAEKVLTAGYLKRGYGMADTALKYCGLVVDKEMQKSFIGHTGPYSDRQIDYAALDCVYPYKIFEHQQKLLQQWGLWDAFIIECEAIPAFGDSAFFGMTLNENKWVSNIITEQKKSKEASDKFMAISAQYSGEDLFGRSTVNINSPAQMLSYLQDRFGVDELKDRDGKPGTGVEILEALVDKHGKEHTEDIKQILKVRGCEKRVGTYGYTYINHVHPADGMFHPRVEQLGTDTGRPAGKKPNMLNIPSEVQYRQPWEAPPGFKFLNDDYGACELRIMASLSGDPVMCEGFRSGKDFHTYTASQFVKDDEQFEKHLIINDEAGKHKYGDFILDAQGNKKENPFLGKLVPYERVLKIMRTVAKTINFG